MKYPRILALCSAILAVAAAAEDVSMTPQQQIVVDEVVAVSVSAYQTRSPTEYNHEYVRVLTLAGPEGGDTIWDLAVDDEGWLYVAGDYTALHFDGDGIPELQSLGDECGRRLFGAASTAPVVDQVPAVRKPANTSVR